MFVERIAGYTVHSLWCLLNQQTAYLILPDDMRHHLATASLQTFVGQRLEAHLLTVEGGCLQSADGL